MTRELSLRSTPVPGLLVLDLPVHGDARGWFKENWQREKMTALGLPDFGPVQHNISHNAEVGTTRGIHAEPWDKYVTVATGRVFGAWVDLRRGESFGAVFTLELGPEQAVFVPRGVGNAFQTLVPETAYSYLVNDHWSAQAQEQYTFLNLADETVAIDWPVPLERARLSEKDRHHPRLPQVRPMDPAPVLVTGADGQLGRALVRACRSQGLPCRATTRAELDLSAAGWEQDFPWGSFSAVVNAAAHTGVDAAETPEQRSEAWAANALGAARLTAVAARHGLPLVQVSTDYVFDGALPVGQFYAPEHPVAPLGAYGASKAAGEAAARAWTKHYVVRTSWVVGEGKNFVDTMRGLAERGVSPEVVADQHGRPTFAADLAAGILHLLQSEAPYGTYHLSNAGPVTTWAELAAEVYALTGHPREAVVPTSTQAYFAGREHAPRPANSALDLARIQEVEIGRAHV